MKRTLIAALLLALAFPAGYAAGHTDWERNVPYYGTNCAWRGILSMDGTHAQMISRHISGSSCDMMLARLKYCKSGSTECPLLESNWNFPAASVAAIGASDASYGDANIRRNGTWYGFRVRHP